MILHERIPRLQNLRDKELSVHWLLEAACSTCSSSECPFAVSSAAIGSVLPAGSDNFSKYVHLHIPSHGSFGE